MRSDLDLSLSVVALLLNSQDILFWPEKGPIRPWWPWQGSKGEAVASSRGGISGLQFAQLHVEWCVSCYQLWQACSSLCYWQPLDMREVVGLRVFTVFTFALPLTSLFSSSSWKSFVKVLISVRLELIVPPLPTECPWQKKSSSEPSDQGDLGLGPGLRKGVCCTWPELGLRLILRLFASPKGLFIMLCGMETIT